MSNMDKAVPYVDATCLSEFIVSETQIVLLRCDHNAEIVNPV